MTTSAFTLAPPDGKPTADKSPNASLLYGLDVAGLLATGDTLATVQALNAAGVTAGTATFSGTVISVRVSGGALGATGSVTLRWTTTAGDTDERTLYFRIVQT